VKASKRFKQSMQDLIINQYGVDGPFPSYYKLYFNSYEWRGVLVDKGKY